MNPANAVTALVTIPKVAAIIIAHNQALELRRAIAALERSEHREQMEILVVDCASDDSTAEVAEEFPGITMQRLPENFGATKALNIATRTARAEYLFLLSPDVEVAPDTVARLAEKLDAEPSVTGACPLLSDVDGKPLARTRPFPDRQMVCRWRTSQVGFPRPRRKGGDIRGSLDSFLVCLHFRRLMIDCEVTGAREHWRAIAHFDKAEIDQCRQVVWVDGG